MFQSRSNFAQLLLSRLLMVVAVTMLTAASVDAQTVIYENNFDTRAPGTYTDDDLDADWNEPRFNNGVTEGRVSIVSGNEAFGGTGSALAVEYPAGFAGPRDTGAQWQLEFDESYEELFFSYRVQFVGDFDFVRGGKLPGLAGGTAPTGSAQATGDNGWAGRLMWRTDFTGVSGQPEQPSAFGIEYAKHTTSGFAQDGRQEDDTPFSDANGNRVTYVPGQWYQITQRIKMNTPGEFDGIQQVWVDDNLVYTESNLLFRTTDEFAIDQVYFSTFFGGGSTWQTSKDETVYFDDFVVYLPDADDPNNGGGDDGVLHVPGDFDTLTEAVQSATAGDTIHVAGLLVENVLVNKSVSIIGEPGAALLAANENGSALVIAADHVHLQNLEINSGSFGVNVLGGYEGVTLDGLFVGGARLDGCKVAAGCSGFSAINCEFRGNGNDGLRVTGSHNIELRLNFLNRNNSNGVRLTDCDNVLLTENKTFQNRLHGFRLSGDHYSVVDNQSLDNGIRGFFVHGGTNHSWLDNLAKDNNSHGFSFDALTYSSLVGNRSRFNGIHGFRIWSNSDFNVFDDSNSTSNGRHGILVGNSSNNQIIDSFIFENESVGIVLNAGTSSHLVTENVVDSNVRFGIANSGQDNVIDDNIVQDAAP